jgi:hypothetical protein
MSTKLTKVLVATHPVTIVAIAVLAIVSAILLAVLVVLLVTAAYFAVGYLLGRLLWNQLNPPPKTANKPLAKPELLLVCSVEDGLAIMDGAKTTDEVEFKPVVIIQETAAAAGWTAEEPPIGKPVFQGTQSIDENGKGEVIDTAPPPKRKRPVNLEREGRLVKAVIMVHDGHSLTRAAKLAGVSRNTLRARLNKG